MNFINSLLRIVSLLTSYLVKFRLIGSPLSLDSWCGPCVARQCCFDVTVSSIDCYFLWNA